MSDKYRVKDTGLIGIYVQSFTDIKGGDVIKLSMWDSGAYRYFWEHEVEPINIPKSKTEPMGIDAIAGVKDNPIKPNHYQINGMEIWDIQIKTWGVEKFIAHLEMSAFEYRHRAGKKEGQPYQRDIEKALTLENKIKELKETK